MPPILHHLLSHRQHPNSAEASSYFARSSQLGAELALPVVVGAVIFFPIVLLLVLMFRQAAAEGWVFFKRAKEDNTEEVQIDGLRSKPELSADSSAVRQEMDGQQEPQELPERKEGLPHELPSAHNVPQELSAEIPVVAQSDRSLHSRVGEEEEAPTSRHTTEAP